MNTNDKLAGWQDAIREIAADAAPAPAVGDKSAEDQFEEYVASLIAKAPNARGLGERLGDLLDEDDFNGIEPQLIALSRMEAEQSPAVGGDSPPICWMWLEHRVPRFTFDAEHAERLSTIGGYDVTPLWDSPPATQSDARDAERYRYIATIKNVWSILGGEFPNKFPSEADGCKNLSESIDAAIAAQAGSHK